MTPLEVTVKTLAGHWRVASRGIRAVCACGWTSVDPRSAEAHGKSLSALHAAHQAAMLAAAGVVMGVQEWGVRCLDGKRVRSDMSKAEAERWAALARPRMYPDAHLVSRWTGATAWTAEEGTK